MEFRSHQTVAVILAAGFSSRMGRPKALVEFRGCTFLERILKLYDSQEIANCVVLGHHHQQIQSQVDLSGSLVLINPRPEEGPLSSLKLALKEINRTSALILHAVDHPLVLPATVEGLCRTQRQSPSTILIPTYRGQKGHPVLFSRRFYPDLLSAPLKSGARWVVRRHLSSTLHVPVKDSGILANLNTPKDLKEWGLA